MHVKFQMLMLLPLSILWKNLDSQTDRQADIPYKRSIITGISNHAIMFNGKADFEANASRGKRFEQSQKSHKSRSQKCAKNYVDLEQSPKLCRPY